MKRERRSSDSSPRSSAQFGRAHRPARRGAASGGDRLFDRGPRQRSGAARPVRRYFFDDEPEVGPEFAVIRRGTGYQDLAYDLLAMADLYERDAVRAVVSHDPKNYRDSDVGSARGYAQTIFRALVPSNIDAGLGLAESDDAQRWAASVQRAWTLLLRGYERTRAAAGVLFTTRT